MAVQSCVPVITADARFCRSQSGTGFSVVSMSSWTENLDKVPPAAPVSIETACCMSKMPLAKKHCNNRLSVFAYSGMCGERAENALLRTKTLGSQRFKAISLEAPQ